MPPLLPLYCPSAFLPIISKRVKIQVNYLSALLNISCQKVAMDIVISNSSVYISTVEIIDEHQVSSTDDIVNESYVSSSSTVEFSYDNNAIPQNRQVKKPRFFMNPYIVFTKSCWAEFRAANPDAKIDQECFQELTRHFAAKWKELSRDQKLAFEEQSAADKARYQRLMLSYNKSQSMVEKNKVSPKEKTLNSYMHFVKDEREKVRLMMPQASMVEVSHELGRRWNNLDPSLKEVYKTIAEQARKQISESNGKNE